MFFDPRFELKYVEKVRHQNNGDDCYYAIEDIIRSICEPDDARRLLNEVRCRDGMFRSLDVKVKPLESGSGARRSKQMCPVVSEGQLMDLLSILPGLKASRFYVDLFEAQRRKQFRKRFLDISRPYWEQAGKRFQKLRESLGLSLNSVSRELGVSASRLRRFENGLAVKDAKLIENAYRMLVRIELAMRALDGQETDEFGEMLKETTKPWREEIDRQLFEEDELS